MKPGTRIKVREVNRRLARVVIGKTGYVIKKDETHEYATRYATDKWVRVALGFGNMFYLQSEELEIIEPIKLKKFSAWK